MADAPLSILFVDEDPDDARAAERALGQYPGASGWHLRAAAGMRDALDALARRGGDEGASFGLLVVRQQLPDGTGLDLLRAVRHACPDLPTILLTERDDARVAVEAMKLGAADCLVRADLAGAALGRASRAAVERAWLATQAREQARRLEELAIRDELTQLYNRRHFAEVMEVEFQRCRRYHHRLALVLLDLDGFKEVNDGWGHLFGDTVLQAAAAALRETLRDVDVAARYGGDEFCVLLPDTNDEGATVAAERIRTALQRCRLTPPDAGGDPVHLSCSAGVAAMNDPGVDSPRDLIAHADTALMHAKRAGRNRVCVYARLDAGVGESPVEAHRRLRTLADALAGRVRDFKRAYIDTIQTLTEAVEAREPGAAGHSRQVAAYADRLGRALGLREAELGVLVNAALVHDVGKVVVPERVLQKPGPLDEAEWRVVRRHAGAGGEVLEKALLLEEERPAVVHHHEHWDGVGYPFGLAGTRIPLAARIIALADAYDAMRMGRAYELPHTQEQAYDVMRREAGGQFDPDLVPRFIAAVGDWLPASVEAPQGVATGDRSPVALASALRQMADAVGGG